MRHAIKFVTAALVSAAHLYRELALSAFRPVQELALQLRLRAQSGPGLGIHPELQNSSEHLGKLIVLRNRTPRSP